MYKRIISPILDRLDSETWHNIARESIHYAEISPLFLRFLEFFNYDYKRLTDKRLGVNIAGVNFDNPITVGAGWDNTVELLRDFGTWDFLE